MDEKIEKAITPLLAMYEQIETNLLTKIASHFSINEEFLNSDMWRIKKLEEMGLFNQEIIEYLSKYTNKTPNEIKKALEKIKVDTINIGQLNQMYEEGKLKINPSVLINNSTINSIIMNAYNELSERFIEMSKKIEESTRGVYLDIVENAYLKTSMGTHSYEESIKEAINDLSNDGIDVLVYKTTDESGNIVGIRSYDIEGAARREILTAGRQLSNNISIEVANNLESEYLYLSEHLQCRPAHFDWQGTIIKREDLVRITHYGEVDGLAGINCRHYIEPYFGDARDDELKHFNKEECTEAYDLSQKQRYLERGVRKWKRKAEMFKANDDIDSYSKCKEKVKEWQLRTKEFIEKYNLKRDFNREYTVNYDTAEAKIPKNEPVLTIKQDLTYKDVTVEWLKDIGVEEGSLRNQNYVIDSDNKYIVDNKNVILDHSKNEERIAEWYAKNKKVNIKMLPRVLNPPGIKTGDFIEESSGFVWEIKEPTGNSLGTTILNQFKGQKKKAHRFIIDMHHSEMDINVAIKEIQSVLMNKRYDWVEEIVLLNNLELKKVFKR